MFSLYWFVMLALAVASCGAKDDNIVEVLKLTQDICEDMFTHWGEVATDNNNGVVDLLGAVDQLLQKMTQLESQLQIDAIPKHLPNIANSMPSRLENNFRKLMRVKAGIRAAGVTLKTYTQHPGQMEKLTMENFARWCVSHDMNAIPALMEEIHALVVPDAVDNGIMDKGALTLLSDWLEYNSNQACKFQISPQQLIYNLYNSIVLTEIMGYSLMHFSRMLLKVYGIGEFALETTLMRKQFEVRSYQTLAALKSAVDSASREIWRCDPENHVEGETYVAVTRLLQGYVENEVNLNADKSCRKTCSDYSLTYHSNCAYESSLCTRQDPCRGLVRNCYFIQSDMNLCILSRNTRRYDWIKYTNGYKLGSGDGCYSGKTEAISWTRWFVHCSNCMCFCDEEGTSSDRYFSLQEEVTDSPNKVVTGIRFIKNQRVIHLQISQGTLLPRGNIEANSVTWKPVTPVNIRSYSMKKGVHYFTMSYGERKVALDDLKGIQGHLLTGVRMRKVGEYLRLEIRVTPFNFTTGKLSLENSQWTHEIIDSRSRLEPYKPDIPTRHGSSLVDSSPGQYILFGYSDLEADAAQSTIPYLDAQAVTSLLPVPLSGAGLYHKGRSHSGGFLAPKVFTYDISSHIALKIPPPRPIQNNNIKPVLLNTIPAK